MNRLLQVSIAFVLLLVTHEAFCQFNRGRFIAGGSARFASSSSEIVFSGITAEYKTTSVGLNPNVGYFFIDNLAVGASVGLSTSKSKTQSTGSVSVNTSTTIGPFVRYYLPVPVFFQAAALFGHSKNKPITPTGSESNYGTTQMGLAAGYAYLFNDFVALEPMLGYQTSSNKSKETDTESSDGSFYLSCAFTIYLGERK